LRTYLSLRAGIIRVADKTLPPVPAVFYCFGQQGEEAPDGVSGR
jgi:hypothetical protein